MRPTLTFITAILLLLQFTALSQEVPILSYSTDINGKVLLEVDATEDNYYILHVRHTPSGEFEEITSMTLGEDGPLYITEPLEAYPLEHYQILEHPITSPADTDGDGEDDMAEFLNMPTYSPLNHAQMVAFTDGTVAINDLTEFSALSNDGSDFSGGDFLEGREFVKFVADVDSENPEVYFMNMETHTYHFDFMDQVDGLSFDALRGEIIYHPNIVHNGTPGVFSFNYSFGEPESFEKVRKTHEIIAANMPFLKNNLFYLVLTTGENAYNNEIDLYNSSRIPILFEDDIYANVDYLALNIAEGYGYFRLMDLEETPGSKDIVLYDALPNSLPRVGGIMTSVIQTPLSHVNLRAIQDNVPNAFIRDPLQIDSIAALLNNYIYYKVEEDRYYIREATLEEVNAWYEALRPTEPQIPERDLSFTEILPLDSIQFEMSTAFGAKCSNVATMRNFGFPEGTIPNGFGVPFYFYDEFMKYNNFYQAVEVMINDPDFINNLDTRIEMLDDFRDDIKDAPMPQWMLDQLQEMHASWPAGTSIRCRSSTNNEDLPGFSGAGLYTSKTQHPEEGHISKSIKQVYASMWNFRAFEERDFYRIDQYIAAMGVLCHPNYKDEKSNGVGVSIDPIYQTTNTFYLNTQVGEDLVTNPGPNDVPEEILLYTDPNDGYFVLRQSNLVESGELVMDEIYLDQLREYLQVIHDEFAVLYNVVGAEGFGMDIEYKVTAQDQLIIKQARPWVSFWTNIKSTFDLAVEDITEPQNSASLGDSELVTAKIANKGLKEMSDFDISLHVDDQFIETITVTDTLQPFNDAEYQFTVPQDFSVIGDYDIMAIVSDTSDGYSRNDTLNVVLSKLHLLEGGISVAQATAQCGNEVKVIAKVTNYGEATFNTTEIEVVVNGLVVETIVYTSDIPYLAVEEVEITVTENLQESDNEITLNLLSVNGQQDAIPNNNSVSTITDLDPSYNLITIIFNADDWPSDISWQLNDELNNEVIAAGDLEQNIQVFSEDFCVDYGSCLSLNVFDSYGDGLCCSYGEGNFLVLDAFGNTLVSNDGDFGHEANELFCPDGSGCAFTAEIATTNASNENAADGTITINPTTGFDPYQYSIDGGQTFFEDNTFTDLAPGDYMIVVQDASETCFYEETITIEFGVVNNINEVSSNEIKVFPNPTTNDLIIEIDGNSNISGTVQIEIYDNLGKLIQTNTVSKNGVNSQTVISLNEYAPGSYFAKCYNNTFERYFKVIKL